MSENQMTETEKIDYMIQSLMLAKDEIAYAQNFINEKNKEDKGSHEYGYHYYCCSHREPNGTIIRESLRMVGRMANILANNVVLTSYHPNEVFKKERN